VTGCLFGWIRSGGINELLAESGRYHLRALSSNVVDATASGEGKMMRTAFDGQVSAKPGVPGVDITPTIAKPLAPLIKDRRPIRTIGFSCGSAQSLPAPRCLRAADTAELSDNAARLTTADWPHAVIDFYLGRRSLDEMLAAASNANEQCESAFFAGEWQLLHGNKAEARALLQVAVDTCPKTFVEYPGAISELRRLGQ
jgi:hypothetical protein